MWSDLSIDTNAAYDQLSIDNSTSLWQSVAVIAVGVDHGKRHQSTFPGGAEANGSGDEPDQGASSLDAVSTYFELYGEFDQLQDLDDDTRRLAEWTIFKNWAERRGNCYSAEFGNFTGEGGHEHEVVLQKGGYYLKRTKWENSGLTYDAENNLILPATVSEYLFRLAWQDFFFGTSTRILGIAEERPYRYAILTRQKEVVGQTPNEDKMKAAMLDAGFTFIAAPPDGPIGGGGAIYHFKNIFYVADVRIDNCVLLTGTGNTMDISAWDFFITPVDATGKQMMTRMMSLYPRQSD